MEEEFENKKTNKERIVTNVITGTLITVISVVILFALYTVITPLLGDNFGLVQNNNVEGIARVTEAINRIKGSYIDEVSDEDLINGAIAGVAAATGDPYTRYMTEEEYQNMMTSGTEVYGGIGVHISYNKEKNGIMVLGVMPNSPAIEAGIKVGDLIVKVGDMVVSSENYNEGINNIRGEEGTKVSLFINRNEEYIEMQVERRKISVSNIDSDVLDGDIGYIKIWAFENDIYKQFKQEYDNLRSKNIKGLVIDLRNNPGGLVSETLNIAKLLLPKGDILRLVYKTGREKVYKDDDDIEIDIPLTVIVNGRSASASEILAGAIKDMNKGVVIGTTTYGKGIVQTIEKLGNNGALSITTSKYYTVSGIEIHGNGIEPNFNTQLPKEYENEVVIPRVQDTQLNRAIEYINSTR